MVVNDFDCPRGCERRTAAEGEEADELPVADTVSEALVVATWIGIFAVRECLKVELLRAKVQCVQPLRDLIARGRPTFPIWD